MFRRRPGGRDAVRSTTLVGRHIAIATPCTALAAISQCPLCDRPPPMIDRPRRKAPATLIIFGFVISAITPAARRHDPLVRLCSCQHPLQSIWGEKMYKDIDNGLVGQH